MQLTREEKIEFCEKYIAYFSNEKKRMAGFCNALWNFLCSKQLTQWLYNDDDTYAELIQDWFPELHAAKPDTYLIRGNWWFEKDEAGYNTRVEILKQILKELQDASTE